MYNRFVFVFVYLFFETKIRILNSVSQSVITPVTTTSLSRCLPLWSTESYIDCSSIRFVFLSVHLSLMKAVQILPGLAQIGHI